MRRRNCIDIRKTRYFASAIWSCFRLNGKFNDPCIQILNAWASGYEIDGKFIISGDIVNCPMQGNCCTYWNDITRRKELIRSNDITDAIENIYFKDRDNEHF